VRDASFGARDLFARGGFMKKFWVLAMAVALLAPIAVISAGPAGAAGGTKCAAPSGKLAITPGLSTTPKVQTTVINLPVKKCTGGGVTTGVAKGTIKGTKAQTCASFFSNPAATTIVTTITWSPKSMGTSTFTAATKLTSSKSAITVVIKGKITKGLFKGKTLSTTVKVTLNGKCTPAAPLKSITLTGLKPLVIA
jgi:hypothetical protein